MESSTRSIARLQCQVQTYAWGKLGTTSAVARLYPAAAAADDEDEEAVRTVEPDTPYAELWMGTHPNGPSRLHAHPGRAALPLEEYLGAGLPFLFKVLSVNKALSIQAHPDKALAARLHAERPTVYKDANHKPEMAIAVTAFEAMCGFRPAEEIAVFLDGVPELRRLVGDESSTAFGHALREKLDVKPQLKQMFAALMKQSIECVKVELSHLIERLATSEDASVLPSMPTSCRSNLDLKELVLRLSQQYPADVGVFCVFFLNLLRLNPGDAVFLAANEPHAYLDGDIIECMACSDNVVRAGLTPKLRDVDTLVEMLTYNTSFPHLLQGEALDTYTTTYSPPIDEFYLSSTQLPPAPIHAPAAYDLNGVGGLAAIILCYSGSGTISCDGDAIPLCPGTVVVVTSSRTVRLISKGDGLRVFRCSSNPNSHTNH